MYVIFFVYFYILSYSHYVVDRLSNIWPIRLTCYIKQEKRQGVGQSIE